MTRKNIIRITVNTIIGVVLILIWLQFVDLSAIFSLLPHAKLGIALLFVVFLVVSTILRSIRLKIMLKKYPFPLHDLVALNFLGHFLSFLVPLKLGEVAKSTYMVTTIISHDRKTKNNGVLSVGEVVSKSIVWIFIDRFLDFWVYLGLLALFLIIVSPRIPILVFQAIMALFLAFSLAALLMIWSFEWSRKLLRLISRLLIIPRFRTLFLKTTYSIADGFLVLHRPILELFWLIFLSLLAVVSDSVMLYSVLISLSVPMRFSQAILANTFWAMASLIPSAPGNIGSTEASGAVILGVALGIEGSLASAATILFHILTLISLPIFGIISLYFLKFNLASVWQRLREN